VRHTGLPVPPAAHPFPRDVATVRRSSPNSRGDIAAALTDRITAAPALLDALTPLVGLLLRDRGEKVPA